MYKTSQETQVRKDEKRRRILDAAARVFAAQGYHGTAVKDVAAEAGISIGSLYFYFKGKEELFAELYGSIVAEFNEVTAGVLDLENNSLVKNFTRVMTATLWMYDKRRELARIILLEAARSEPAVQRLEAERLRGFTELMCRWFELFRQNGAAEIADARTAALIYAGSYNCLINERLAAEDAAPLTDCAGVFCAYHLRALGISFGGDEIKAYIAEVIAKLDREASIQNRLERGRQMDNERKKALRDSYKAKPVIGGIYKVSCTASGHSIIKSTPDMDGIKKRFEFSQKIKGCPDPALHRDFLAHGYESFRFEELETLKKGELQTPAEFSEDIASLLEMWLEKDGKEKQNG